MGIANEVINYELERFGNVMVDRLEQEARSKLPEATGKGNRSFRRDVIRANQSQIGQALFIFEEYLRFFDMRKRKYGYPDIAKISKWIEETGISKFKSKYESKYGAAKDYTQMLNRIAFGISRSIKNRGKLKTKRIKWYNQTKEEEIYGKLYTSIRIALSKTSLDKLKKAIV